MRAGPAAEALYLSDWDVSEAVKYFVIQAQGDPCNDVQELIDALTPEPSGEQLGAWSVNSLHLMLEWRSAIEDIAEAALASPRALSYRQIREIAGSTGA